MVIGPKGYEPLLEVHLDSLVVTSSLNDIRLINAESCRVSVPSTNLMDHLNTLLDSWRSPITTGMEC